MHRSEALALPPGCGAAGRAWISNAPGFQPGAGGRRSRGTVPRSRAGDRCTRRGVTRAGRPLRGTALSACDHRRTRWGALHRRRVGLQSVCGRSGNWCGRRPAGDLADRRPVSRRVAGTDVAGAGRRVEAGAAGGAARHGIGLVRAVGRWGRRIRRGVGNIGRRSG